MHSSSFTYGQVRKRQIKFYFLSTAKYPFSHKHYTIIFCHPQHLHLNRIIIILTSCYRYVVRMTEVIEIKGRWICGQFSGPILVHKATFNGLLTLCLNWTPPRLAQQHCEILAKQNKCSPSNSLSLTRAIWGIAYLRSKRSKMGDYSRHRYDVDQKGS